MPEPSSRGNKKLAWKPSPSLIGAGVGFIVSMAIIIYSYIYALARDPQIANYLHYLVQKQYRLLQLIVQLFPVAIGYFWGRGREERARLKAVAQEKTRLYQETLAKQKALDGLMYRVSQAHEEERRRISRELHDGLAQNLSGMILNLDFLRKQIKEEGPQVQVKELEDLVKETIVDLRKIINNLRPPTLESLGLIPTLERKLEQFEKGNKIKTTFKTNLEERLPPIFEIASFGLIQEALNNIQKHAQASEVNLKVEKGDSKINITVKDNGKGFDLKKVTETQRLAEKGFGLTGMRERTETLGGNLNIITQAGEGTEIRATIPLSSPKEA